MNKKHITFYFLVIIAKKIFGIPRGQDSSFIYLSESNIFDYDKIINLIVFGDSHSNARTNYTTMEIHPDPYRTTWPVPLSDIHKMKLWDYAARGAVVDLNITYRKEDYVIDLKGQYELFYKNMLKNQLFNNQWNSNNTIFAIYFGSNDIHDINFIKTNQTVFQVIDNLADIISYYTEKMYNVGARNFLFINISPLDEAPINSKGKHKYYKDEIPYFNNIINEKLKKLFNKYSDINIILYNNNNEYRHIMENYKEYGYISGKLAWFQKKELNHNDYFWRDYTHINNKGNKIIAEDINDLLYSLNKERKN